ncbi:hypothetical protein HNP00_001537 [Arthrobacter sp. AZCC_0090]|nr:hypothetical protein [Arthrobacter sp. AZCC_0090]
MAAPLDCIVFWPHAGFPPVDDTNRQRLRFAAFEYNIDRPYLKYTATTRVNTQFAFQHHSNLRF